MDMEKMAKLADRWFDLQEMAEPLWNRNLELVDADMEDTDEYRELEAKLEAVGNELHDIEFAAHQEIEGDMDLEELYFSLEKDMFFSRFLKDE